MQKTDCAKAQPVHGDNFYSLLRLIAFKAKDKSKSADTLKSIPPNISVIQCTPLKMRRMSINTVKRRQRKFMKKRVFTRPIIRWKIIMALGNTHKASIVVEEG